jgi:Zn-dependent protease/CBS domain-containing protein
MIAQGTRVGRLFGVELRIDWSWFFIFILLTWNLVAIFAAWHPDWTRGGVFLVAVAAALIFFGCILLHELAHSLVAMAHGTRVRSITLFLFGGVSDIEREPNSPSAEILTAVVGPITSIALGVIFLLLTPGVTGSSLETGTSAWEIFGGLSPLGTLFAWLGPINIAIGMFNMVPAFPLDGGRILRAILWAVMRDLRKATRAAAFVGGLVGWLFIVTGVSMSFGAYVPYFGTGLANGLWLAFIGWFIAQAASRTNARMAIDEALAGMTVAQLMQTEVPTVSPDLPLGTVVQHHLVRGSDRAVAVVQVDVFLGLVCVADIRNVPPEQWETMTASSVMRRADALTMTAPDRPLSEAFESMARHDIDQLPVISGGRLVGMLRRRDVTRWLELVWRGGAAAEPGRAQFSGRPPSRAPGAPPPREPYVRPI